MMKQQSGKIINIGSVNGREGSAGATAYCAAKGGVHNFTHALAKEAAPYNINVNCVAPCAVNTPMLQGGAAMAPERYGIKEEEFYDYFCKMMHILGREITVEDISNAVLFLASEESRNIDGLVIYVDGGHIMVP
jgi:3-oxoacyl-[acyl-carrier protein] reductase